MLLHIPVCRWQIYDMIAGTWKWDSSSSSSRRWLSASTTKLLNKRRSEHIRLDTVPSSEKWKRLPVVWGKCISLSWRDFFFLLELPTSYSTKLFFMVWSVIIVYCSGRAVMSYYFRILQIQNLHIRDLTSQVYKIKSKSWTSINDHNFWCVITCWFQNPAQKISRRTVFEF